MLLSHSEYYHFRQARVPLRWMSPEAILEGDFSTKSDVWAFGVLMWEVFTHGEMPHGGQADDEVLAGRQLCFQRLIADVLQVESLLRVLGLTKPASPLRAGVSRYTGMATPAERLINIYILVGK